MPMQVCTAPGSCKTENTAVVLDVGDPVIGAALRQASDELILSVVKLAMDPRHQWLYQLL